MYDHCVGKVSTVITTNGAEYIGMVLGVDADANTVLLENLKMVYLSDNSVQLVPAAFTAPLDTVTLPNAQIVIMEPSLDTAAEDYTSFVAREAEESTRLSQS